MNGPNLSVGAVGEEVRSLHERLRRQGNELPESETSRAFFGPGTREAVRQIQLQHGLQGHGVVDATTMAVIGATSRQPVETSATPHAAGPPAMTAREGTVAGTMVLSAPALVGLPVGKRRTVAAAAALAALPSQAEAAVPAPPQGLPGGGQPAAPVAAATAAAAALTAFQLRVGLPATGQADDATVARIVAETAHQHVAGSAMRTAKVQQMLAKIGFAAGAQDTASRTMGDSTVDAVKRFQQAEGLAVDGLVGDHTLGILREAALTATLSSKRQTHLLQRKILRAAKVRGLDVAIDAAESRARTAGPSTQAAVRALQASLGLPPTGTVDTTTFERIGSVAASRRAPAARLAAPDPAALSVVPRQLRLNMANKHVPKLQRALAFLGHPPVEAELKASRFGPSTRRAVIAFQASNGLLQTGAADGATLRALNLQIRSAAPGPEHAYRIRGTVRDTSWAGRAGVTVELATDPAVGDPVVLATRATLGNGFYDLPYAVPKDPSSGNPVSPLSLRIRFVDAGGGTIGTKRLIDPTPITWVNFTEGPYPYRGSSLQEAQLAAVRSAGTADVRSLVETADRHDVTRVAQLAGLTQDDLMRLILSARAAQQLGGGLDATVCFAFLAQSLPSSLPDDLLAQTHEWTLIDQLTDLVAAGIAAMEPELAASALDAALAQNVVPVTLAAQLDAVLAELTSARRMFALDRPVLVGNGTLRSTLQRSEVPATGFDAVADAFVSAGGMGPAFWSLLRESPETYGGADAVASLERAVGVGLVAKNFDPMVQELTQRIAATAPRELAKLAPQDWLELVTDVGSVPDGTDGDTEEARRATYARTMAAQAQRLFPTVAVTAAVKRTGAGGLTRIDDIEQIVDAHPNLDLRVSNIDTFAAKHDLQLEPETRAELKVLQRVHRIAPTADTATALLANGLHSSVQIMAQGRNAFMAKMKEAGVEESLASSIHGFAEFQYAQVLQRLGELRSEVQSTMPAALAPHVLTAEVRAQLLSDLPDLELLFGPLDACDCPHCASVYGPAAYLADVFRFLDNHAASTGGGTVLDVLRGRRPDLTKVKLDCANTETTLPFIDLTNEVLESVFPGSAAQVDLQTTLPANELRAAPEHQDNTVYDLLRTSDIPISSAYDLWADQIRFLLQHLGVPRWQLMEVLGPSPRTDIAAEYFAISVHEAGLITSAKETSADQDGYWGFDSTRASIPVLEIMERTKLSYLQLQLLLQSAWITPDGDPRVHITRPATSADLRQQTLDALTPTVLDRVHRLLRLARHTPWNTWELDLLLRAERIGAGTLDGDALVSLHGSGRLADRLGIGAEQLATWFGTLPMVGRPSPTDPTAQNEAAPSRYAVTFRARALSGAPDPAFDPVPDGTGLAGHRSALLAALAVNDTALTALLARTGTANDLPTLSRLVAWAELARALRIDLADLLLAADLLEPALADPLEPALAYPFASPADLLTFLDLLDVLRGCGLPLAEQDYLLNARPDSPVSATDNAIATALSALREGLRANPDADPSGAVISALAVTTRLVPTQVQRLLDLSDATGKLLDAFTAPALLARNPDGSFVHPAVTPADFPRLFEAYRRVLKMGRVVSVLRLSDDDLAWLLAHIDVVGLRLTDLPVADSPAASLSAGWIGLLRWAGVRRDLLAVSRALAAAPGTAPAVPSSTPDDLIAAAAGGEGIDAVRAHATVLTGIDAATLETLDGDDPATYTDAVFGRRLVDAAAQLKRLGVPAATAAVWASRDRVAGPSERDVATAVTAAAMAKYERAAWLSVLTPLQDDWREHKRDALVAYLLEHAARTQPPTVQIAGREYANPLRWTSTDDLLRYFLIDVETSSCALTSRIKQAIGSTQMFVQRAFLNLEKPRVVITTDEKADLAAPDSWRQWKWMKSYRLWEANRKIFLYPENWIAPELRDDKTPFFKELEQEVLSGDITAERCEEAMRSYLGKLHDVANLEVVGVHHEIDDDHPWDDLGPSVNVLHVVGRTRGEPFRYFYRSYDINAALWSPWETIEVDISGDQVLPVVYNRMLHLFWLQMESKPQKTQRQPAAAANTTTQQSPEAPTQLELKLAWTVRRAGSWTTRQSAPNVLVHPWPRPRSSYSLKPRYHPAENQLWIDVYVSMSPEFNGRSFWDPVGGGRRPLTKRTFDATARPWHSSSFVYDGQVVALRLKPLDGQYQLLDGSSTGNSFDYVRVLSDPQGRTVQTLKTTRQVSARVVQPDGMRLESGRMVNNTWTGNNGALTVLSNGASVTLLTGARSPFAAVHSLHRIQPDTASDRSPFVYVDPSRSYYVTSQWVNVTIDSTTTVQRLTYTFRPFSHPYASLFIRELNRSGPDGLLNRTIQRFPNAYPPGNTFSFAAYAPVAGVAVADPTAATETLDFCRSGAMSVYNWEVFFHIPFLIACKLATNQRFEESLDWFHRIFDPSNTEALNAPKRYWITKPFFDTTDEDYTKQRIESILADANDPEVSRQIAQWRNHPFMPDVIARFRLVAYQKAVVMRYIDALIDWGDRLFRRETIEAINEATLLYVLAGELLGRRPEHVPMIPREGRSYDELTAEAELDPFGNQQVEVQLENLAERPTLVVASDNQALPVVKLSYFAIPANDDLLGYWDRVADRLFKIRNCMDISGRVRQLPLFEPPIDPALLVRAIAAGVDLDSVLNDTPASGSAYRYATLFASAMSAASDLRSLGERMLVALQRRDDDALERLRAGNEVALVSLVQRVREAQVLEAQRAREAVEQSLETVQARVDYYSSRPYMNDWETAATVVHTVAVVSQVAATVLNTVAGGASLVPSFEVGASGFGGSPVVTVKYGGENVSNSVGAFARLFEGLSGILHSTGSLLETQGGYQRRFEEHQFQADQARKEVVQVGKQVISAKVREAVAQHELEAHLRSVDNAKSVAEFLRSKYTGEQLYEWMVAQLSGVYFQAYQLAFDMARRAERAYRFEVGDNTTAPIITFGYWDSLKQGLLVGDRLINDLRRLEATALERNRRRLQATTHISLASLMPDKLLELKTTGTTSIEVSEWILARENPGWINQRIVSVAVTAPCVAGPYTGVHAGLALTSAVVRRNDDTNGGFGDAFGGDSRFASAMSAVSAIRTSHSVEDTGRVSGSRPDDRYEAFEGAGAISRWTIVLDPRDNAFDLSTLSDFVLTIVYEGDQGSAALVGLARTAVGEALPKHGAVLLWLDGAYAAQWYRFLHPASGEQTLIVDVGTEALQYLYRQLAQHKRLVATEAVLVMESDEDALDVRLVPPGGAVVEVSAPSDDSFGGLPHATTGWAAGAQNLLGQWTVQVKRAADAAWDALPESAIRRAWLLVQFEAADA
jgi:peptidoglycan hydrolase-like protein with peptidoglycan-binding domain